MSQSRLELCFIEYNIAYKMRRYIHLYCPPPIMALTNASDICMLVITMMKGRGNKTLCEFSLGLSFGYATTTYVSVLL